MLPRSPLSSGGTAEEESIAEKSYESNLHISDKKSKAGENKKDEQVSSPGGKSCRSLNHRSDDQQPALWASGCAS